MEKKTVVTTLICIFLLFLLGIYYIQFFQENEQDMYIANSDNMTFSNSEGKKVCESSFSVIANEDIADNEEYAKHFFELVRENNLNNVLLSTDISGWPVELNVTVYRNEKKFEKGEKLFEFTYTQDNISYLYNIKDNPEKFNLIIRD